MIDTLTSDSCSFVDTVRTRHAVRAFLPDPLTREQINSVVEDAQLTPSNSNSQPWIVHIVSGAARDDLSQALVRDFQADSTSLDFSYDPHYGGGERWHNAQQQGRLMHEAFGIARDDRDGRTNQLLRNFRFFGAPHAAFLFLPQIGDGVRTASDVGMYAQTFLLSLFSRGFGGIAQTILGFFANTVREELRVPAELKLLFGISFGHPDPAALENAFRAPRAPLGHNVFLHT